MTVLKKIIAILLILILLITSLVYDSIYVAPSRFQVRYETLSDTKIPEQLNDLNILYFSDLHYGHNMDKKRLDKLIALINNCAPDVILFGGDLIDDQQFSPEEIQELTTSLQTLEARLGKFAVLGEYDHLQLELVSQILHESNFEILSNKALKIRNTGSQSITLVGIDCSIGGYNNEAAAFQDVGTNSYNLVFAHTPDTLMNLPTDKTDYFIAGHTHGGQVNYLFGSTYSVEQAELALSGKHNVNDAYTIDVSTGVGTVGYDARFLAYPEVVLYRLVHESSAEDK
ncbi:MAG: metallophosphoesterase [Erysipelotrichaceae bacterium]|nr:metallophosphoesterase [Erysipelotrichaceae bacterium]MDY5251377.1 metallophosphoesterase [Erysipelotrichaceae bacterium]